VTVRAVPGLPDIDVALRPITAVIGPRAIGKSRLLAAISWLLSGHPRLGDPGSEAAPVVTGELASSDGPRTVQRSGDTASLQPLPRCWYLPIHERIADRPPTGPAARGWSDAAGAEAMVDAIEAACRAGRSGDVLVIEEPEVMLTPHAQRHLYRLLRAFGRDNQVIYSTRSPAMLDATHHDEILRLDLAAAGLRVLDAPVALLTDEQWLRLAAEFDHERSEMFFARAVVLVEGQTERLSLPAIFRSLGHDPDALGISIVEVGGKGNLPLAARLLSRLAIPHLVVFDADTGATAEAENAAIAMAVGSAPTIRLDPDFEAVAGIRSSKDKVLRPWRRFHDVRPDDVPLQFRRIVETASLLATAGPRTSGRT
ncbi:MAG: TOPRIM nucleotidyl transferase/hydrolase domain-containing protein, partial [Chloroflexota bacterium]